MARAKVTKDVFDLVKLLLKVIRDVTYSGKDSAECIVILRFATVGVFYGCVDLRD